MSEQDDRARREQALRELAREGGAAPRDESATRPSTSQMHRAASARPPRRRIPALVLALIVVIAGIAGGVALRGRAGSTGPTIPKQLTINLLRTDLTCQSPFGGIAWSPDASEIALIGYYQGCGGPYLPGNGTTPGLVEVYDTRNGRLTSTLQLDGIILGQVTPTLPASVTAYLTKHDLSLKSVLAFGYTSVLWSKDGQRLLVPFTVWEPSAPPGIPPGSPAGVVPSWYQGFTVAGLLTMAPNGTGARVALAPSTGQQYDLVSTEWNLQTNTPIAIPDALNANAHAADATKPLGGIAWGANGQLQVMPATQANLVNAPIGNAAGSQQLSVWQPGMMAPNLKYSNSVTTPQPPTWDGTFGWVMILNALSPDGNYLLANAFLPVVPIPPVRDAGQRSALNTLTSVAHAGGAPWALQDTLAWRPDGAELAMWHNAPTAPGPDGSEPAPSPVVTVYDTHTGNILTTLTAHDPPQLTTPTTTAVLAWSADGTRLAYVDTEDILTLWSGSALPTPSKA